MTGRCLAKTSVQNGEEYVCRTENRIRRLEKSNAHMLGLIPTTSPLKALRLFPMEVDLESSSNSRAIARQWTKMVPRRKYQRNWCGRPHSLKRNDVAATQCAYSFPKLQEFLRISMLSIVPRATKGLHEIQWNNRMLDRTVPVSTQPIRLQNTQRAAFTLDVARRALSNQGQRG